MSRVRKDQKIQKLKSDIQNLSQLIQQKHNKIIELNKEASRIRNERIAGVLSGRVDVKEIFTKERRLHTVIDQIRSLRKEERVYRQKQDMEKSDLLVASRLYELASHGNSSASKRADRLLARY